MRNLPQLSEGPAPLLPEPLRQQFSGVATRWQLGTLPKWRDAARTFFHQSSFATHAIANEQNTVKVSKKAPLELLGPLGCGIQTGAGAVMNALDPRPGSSIAIFGCGSVGLSAVLGAVVTGCTTIIVVDLVQSRLDKALELGATHVVNPESSDPVEAIQSITGSGVEYSLECTGLPAVTRQAVDSLTLTGVCGQIGVAPLGTEVSLDINNMGLRGLVWVNPELDQV